jgi:hypothetical protein
MSGVTASLVSLSKSFVMPAIGVASAFTGDAGLICRLTVAAVPVGARNNGSTETEFASRPVAACHAARVG